MRGKGKQNTEEEINLGVIITPFLDMAFQLLIFFIITYHPAALEGHVDGELLPPTKVATKGPPKMEKDDSPPIDEEPKLTDVLMIQVKAVGKGQVESRSPDDRRTEGMPSQIMIKLPEDTAPRLVADTEVKFNIGLKMLKNELEKTLKQGAVGTANIKIEADGDLKHRYAMDVYDTCKLAGFKNIALVAPPNLMNK
jgi:biopolymer transport protein ExbD